MNLKKCFSLIILVTTLVSHNQLFSAAAAAEDNKDQPIEMFFNAMKSNDENRFDTMSKLIKNHPEIKNPSSFFENTLPLGGSHTTALHAAVGIGIPSVIPFLLKHISPTSKDNDNKTPLFQITSSALYSYDCGTDERQKLYDEIEEEQGRGQRSEDDEAIGLTTEDTAQDLYEELEMYPGHADENEFIRDYKQIITHFHTHGASINPSYFDEKSQKITTLLELLENSKQDYLDINNIADSLIAHIRSLLDQKDQRKRKKSN